MHAVAVRDSPEYSLWNAVTVGLLVGMWVGGPIFAVRRFLDYGRADALGQDAHAYWLTAHGSTLYAGHPGEHDAYLYSPIFAQIIRPIAELPFGWFTAIVIAVDVACFAWLLAPLGWKWTVPLLFALAPEFVLGNIIGLLTVAAVLGVSGRAGWWAVGYLTKISPGLLGAAWHASRGEWRPLFRSWAITVALTAASFLVWPQAWREWFEFLRGSGTPWATVRLATGLLLVAVGARRGWWWVIPVCLVVTAPIFGQGTLGYLAGLVRMHPSRGERVLVGVGAGVGQLAGEHRDGADGQR